MSATVGQRIFANPCEPTSPRSAKASGEASPWRSPPRLNSNEKVTQRIKKMSQIQENPIYANFPWPTSGRPRFGTAAEGYPVFTDSHIKALADFCQQQNHGFMRGRWIEYIHGECGPNGG